MVRPFSCSEQLRRFCRPLHVPSADHNYQTEGHKKDSFDWVCFVSKLLIVRQPPKWSTCSVTNYIQGSRRTSVAFPEPEVSALSLDGKHGAKIRYTYYPAAPASSLGHNNRFSQTLIVFLNGLMLPRSSWDASINVFLEKRTKAGLPYPALLSYDRYGQGDSDRDPGDVDPPPCHGHDIMSAVRDLRQFTLQIWKEHLQRSSPTQSPCLVFVCNSIGCAIARLFAQTYPGTVMGMMFLDSIMANSDYQSIWPNPDAPGFDPQTRRCNGGTSERDKRTIQEHVSPRCPQHGGPVEAELSNVVT